MRPFTERLPKALIPVNGVPFASHQLGLLAREGITEVVYSIGYMGDRIRAHVGDGDAWGLRVRYLHDGPTLVGTAGALRKGLASGLIQSPFLTLYGDAFLPIAFPPVVRAFAAADQPALMTVYRNADAWAPSNVAFADGMVRLYDKRPEYRSPDMSYIDYGLSVLTAPALEEAGELAGPADLSEVSHLLSVQGRLAGYEVTERFFEVGSPAGLADLERHLSTSTGAGQSIS